MPQLWSQNDTALFDKLDQFALLACQKYNLGNEPDWFGAFRGGLYGFYARVHGVQLHNDALHNWFPPRVHHITDAEYHLSSILFNMDSSIECLTFALNALGFAASPDGFNDITDRKKLSDISPFNILGRSNRSPLSGYQVIFPSIQEYWVQKRQLLLRIFELHDVSKHRTMILTGGLLDDEVPAGFFEALGVDFQKSDQWALTPHKEIILLSEPKSPQTLRNQPDPETLETLENLIPKYYEFLRETGMRALKDSQSNIPLSYDELQN